MRVAVTGGTGFVGIHTVRALKDAGHEVVIVARGTTRRPKGERVTFVQADITNAPKLAEAFAGCDAVVHLVAIIQQRGRQTFDRVNREGTERVVAAAKEAKVGHFVHQGALGADPDPRYPYLMSKWLAEQAVRASGVPYTGLRPGLIFGPGDGFFTLAHADDADQPGHPDRRRRQDALPADLDRRRDPVHRDLPRARAGESCLRDRRS